jgi:hypothetical protein
MFGTFFKASWKAVPWILILPLAVYAFYLWVIWPYVEMTGIYQDYGTVVFTSKFFLISIVASIIVNLLFVMIIPAAIGGVNIGAKKVQFYIGFLVNLFLTFLFPIIYGTLFAIDVRTDSIIVALHAASFLLPFILGALFVAPAYARAFWFVNRN